MVNIKHLTEVSCINLLNSKSRLVANFAPLIKMKCHRFDISVRN